MDGEDAFCASGKSRAGRADDGRRVQDGRGILDRERKKLHRIGWSAVRSRNCEEVNSFRTGHWRPAQRRRSIRQRGKSHPGRKVPVKLKVAFGTEFLVVIVKVLAVPTTKVALFTLVMRGGRVIVRVKFCVPAGETPLDAVNVRG